MPDPTRNVLFLCTGNSARSILAESLLTSLGRGRFRAFSAGSMPKGEVHPMALAVLRDGDLPHEGFRSKSWSEFSGPDAPSIDYIITVCDNAAGESCPIWPGRPIAAHWGIDDPAAVEGSGQRQAFVDALGFLRLRIERLVALPLGSLDESGVRAALRDIGSESGATGMASA